MDDRRASVRAEIAALMERPGHAVDNARAAMVTLEGALVDGVFDRSEDLEQTLGDLRLALDQSDGAKLGGKSAEAARFITRRLVRLLDQA